MTRAAVWTGLERAAFVLVLAVLGRALAGDRGALWGGGAALIAALAAWWIRRLATRVLVGGVIGLAVGMGLALLFLVALGGLHAGEGLDLPGLRDGELLALKAVLVAAFGYLGCVVGMRRAAALSLEELPFLGGARASGRPVACKVIDTSVVIDGRVAEIVATGFLEGTLVVPQFVLRELQHIADSADASKRNRGRRGLDILKALQQEESARITISDLDFPELRDVDHKLIELARQLGAKIVTTDFNLNKVAELRGVEVLNINQLANALKPAVLVGEVMRVFILKEGKELSQGVAYLDDGTMVVVDNARRAIGKTIDISVTSIHQTTAGKMIFGRYEGTPPVEGGAPPAPGGERREWRRRPERAEAGRSTTPVSGREP